MRALGILAVALALCASAVAAQAQEGPVRLRSEVDRVSMAIGDQVLLTITIEHPPGYTLQDLGVPRALGDFEVVDSLTVLETRSSAGTRTQLRYLITAFELGPKRVPVIVITYRGPDGATGQARTREAHVVDVVSVVRPGEDTTDIKPLKPPLPLPGATNDLTRLAPVVAIAALLLLAAVLALRARRRGPALVETPHGPARAALGELERVLELRLPEQGRTREHYDLVASALRTFISERYALAAQARTARELRRELEHAGAQTSAAQVICELLGDAESVRYEQRAVSPAQAKRSMRDAIELMRKSVIAEEYEVVSSGATA